MAQQQVSPWSINAAVAAGGAAWDHSGMVRVLERLACHEVCQAVAAG